MATRILTPGSTDLSLTASWGGTVPIAGDDVRIYEGNQHVTAGLATLTGLDIGSFANHSGVTFADDLEFDCSAGLVEHYGSGLLRLDGDVATLVCGPGGGARINGGAWTTIITQGGPVEITDQATLNTIYASVGDVVIGSHGSDRVDELYVGRARVRSERSIEVGQLGSGMIELLESATITDGAGGGTLSILGGGELRVSGNAITIDLLIGVDGVLNPQKCRGNLTLTDSKTPGLAIVAGADGSYPGGSIVYTNPASPSAPGVILVGSIGGFAGLGA